MTTQLQLVNNVLRYRLREDAVTTIGTDTYAQMIGAFLNEAITVVQEAHDWSALEHGVTFDTVPGKQIYDLASRVVDGGDADDATARLPNQKSYLLWNQTGFPHAWIFDDDLDQHGEQMYLLDEGHMQRLITVDRLLNSPHPRHMSLRVKEDGSGFQATLWPIPEVVRTISMKFWTPQDVLALDGSDDNTPIIVRPDLMEAYVTRTALNERGEEMGEPGNMADERLLSFLAAAIETDMMNRSRTGRYEMTPD